MMFARPMVGGFVVFFSERPMMNSPFWVKPKLLDSQSEALANLSLPLAQHRSLYVHQKFWSCQLPPTGTILLLKFQANSHQASHRPPVTSFPFERHQLCHVLASENRNKSGNLGIHQVKTLTCLNMPKHGSMLEHLNGLEAHS